MSFLEVEHVSKSFLEPNGQALCVFRNVRLHIEKAEFVTMVGHSGCGKSTLLNIIAGLETASAGAIILDGKETDTAGLDRMVVFQNFSLLPWMSVYENIHLAVRAAFPQWERRKVHDYVQRYINMVGLSGSEHKRPAALSGGMRQRVGLARAFAVQPKVLLLDEPFAQIDALTRGAIQDELMRMWTATKNTVFMVTHDVEEAILLSDRIALMTSGPEARLAEILDVKFPRPRQREQLTDLPEYARIKKHIIRFLTDCVRETPAKNTIPGADAVAVSPQMAAEGHI